MLVKLLEMSPDESGGPGVSYCDGGKRRALPTLLSSEITVTPPENWELSGSGVFPARLLPLTGCLSHVQLGRSVLGCSPEWVPSLHAALKAERCPSSAAVEGAGVGSDSYGESTDSREASSIRFPIAQAHICNTPLVAPEPHPGAM